MNILYNGQNKEYYFSTTESCSQCNKRFIDNQIGLVRVIPRLGNAVFCEKCINKVKSPVDMAYQQFFATATTKIIKNTMVVNENRLEVESAKGDSTAFDFGKMGGKTIDRTRYAKSGGMMMELPTRKPLQELDYDQDKELSVEKMRELLTESKPVGKDSNLLDHVAPPTIEYKKQKQIGMKEAKE